MRGSICTSRNHSPPQANALAELRKPTALMANTAVRIPYFEIDINNSLFECRRIRSVHRSGTVRVTSNRR
jgi:hypothetical protein